MNIVLQAVSGHHPSAKPGAPAAVRAVSLGARAGEQLAIIGPSGAGKTTLLHLMACALQPAAGALLLDGQDPWQPSRRALQRLRKSLFLAPQVPPLPPRQRVVTAVLAGRLPHESLWASLRSLFYPHDIALAHRVLAAFDMSDKLFERVDRISGGERQRVGLARALVSQASLWLVDEPLSALDPTRSQHALDTLTRAAHERGATLIATLHHVEMALAHFPRIVGLRDGAVAFDLPAAQVTPAHLQALYAQHLHELTGPASDAFPTDPAPVVMHCR
ncbi:phosphonate ABC transporter ATP-binding protein [Polaromonas sp.]|uniref:phosphonate ABC transporter ATP-binding protein n=1 Tax=Polaromonas sp. TaxID=1869339 RepID=UPI003BB64138